MLAVTTPNAFSARHISQRQFRRLAAPIGWSIYRGPEASEALGSCTLMDALLGLSAAVVVGHATSSLSCTVRGGHEVAAAGHAVLQTWLGNHLTLVSKALRGRIAFDHEFAGPGTLTRTPPQSPSGWATRLKPEWSAQFLPSSGED